MRYIRDPFLDILDRIYQIKPVIKYLEDEGGNHIAFLIHVDVCAIQNSYCPSPQIYIRAGTSGSPDKGFSAGTMAQEDLHQVPPRTKFSVPNGAVKRLEKERSVFASPC